MALRNRVAVTEGEGVLVPHGEAIQRDGAKGTGCQMRRLSPVSVLRSMFFGPVSTVCEPSSGVDLIPFHLIGRPRGPQMACGWGCGACLTEHQMRTHFTICPKRPAISDHVRRASPHRAAGSGQTNKRLRRSKAKRGRPPGRRMPCGWLCGAKLTASQIRGHFTECWRRPQL